MATPTRRLAALLAGITDNDQATKVTTAGINDDAVNAAKIAANAVGTSEVADNVLTATDLAANSVGESELSVDYTAQSVPHIVPGVLQPAVDGKLLNGANHSGVYGTAQTQSGGDGHKYYYTNIKGSKPIKDPRIGAHFGSQRHKFKSLQLLEQETATHGTNVYSVDGREWIRAVGNIEIQNAGQGLIFNINDTTTFFEITGYFNQFNWLEYLSESGSARNRWILAVDGTATTTESANAVNVDDPRGGRYVDAVGVRTITTGLTTPRIVTIKMTTNSAADNAWASGCELIAQDTTSTANKSKIQIPSQNVVTNGKKFNVSAEGSSGHHYDPFSTMSYGGSGTTTSALENLIDTATSLGMDQWKASTDNYHRPWNGGRIIKWVDGSGTIKTSVTMMPPNAQNITNTVSNPKGDSDVIAGTNAHTINFDSTTIANAKPLHEVAKTFHWREFGNGAANGGTLASGTKADASMLYAADDIVYVMDDGLTSLSGDNVDTDDAGLRMFAEANKDYYYTFIGTGFTFKIDSAGGGAGTHHVVQNLPYGTHVIKQHRDGSNANPHITIDGVQLSSVNIGSYSNISEITFHQPKRPPIPENVVILSDYMLYADWVPLSGAITTGMINKGARRTNCSRDVLIKRDSGSNAPAMAMQTTNSNGSANFGFRITAGVGSPCSVDLPVFSNKFALYAENPAGGSQAVSFGGASSTISVLDNSANDDLEVVVGPTTATDLGVNKIEYTLAGEYHFSGFDSAGIIHTSSHYQSFETPYLHELIGGDRNMEQNNLVVSPDGKTWDEVTRDTSYIGNLVVSANTDSTQTWASIVVFDEWRGVNHNKDVFNKYFAIAYNQLICLKAGDYRIETIGNHNGHHQIDVNNAGQTKSNESHSGMAWTTKLNRGDLVRVFADWGTGNMIDNHFYITKL